MNRARYYLTIAKLTQHEREIFALIKQRSEQDLDTTYGDLFKAGISSPRGTMPRLYTKLKHMIERRTNGRNLVAFRIRETV